MPRWGNVTEARASEPLPAVAIAFDPHPKDALLVQFKFVFPLVLVGLGLAFE